MIIPVLLTVIAMLDACRWVIRKKRKLTESNICTNITNLRCYSRILCIVFHCMPLRREISGITRNYIDESGGIGNGDKDIVAVPFFDLSTLTNATNGFSTDSKLGEVGFGSVVYKVAVLVTYNIT